MTETFAFMKRRVDGAQTVDAVQAKAAETIGGQTYVVEEWSVVDGNRVSYAYFSRGLVCLAE